MAASSSMGGVEGSWGPRLSWFSPCGSLVVWDEPQIHCRAGLGEVVCVSRGMFLHPEGCSCILRSSARASWSGPLEVQVPLLFSQHPRVPFGFTAKFLLQEAPCAELAPEPQWGGGPGPARYRGRADSSPSSSTQRLWRSSLRRVEIQVLSVRALECRARLL